MSNGYVCFYQGKEMRNLENLSEWTKVELCQVINQALFQKSEPFPADHFRVQRMAKTCRKDQLIMNCEMAIEELHKEFSVVLMGEKRGGNYLACWTPCMKPLACNVEPTGAPLSED